MLLTASPVLFLRNQLLFSVLLLLIYQSSLISGLAQNATATLIALSVIRVFSAGTETFTGGSTYLLSNNLTNDLRFNCRRTKAEAFSIIDTRSFPGSTSSLNHKSSTRLQPCEIELWGEAYPEPAFASLKSKLDFTGYAFGLCYDVGAEPKSVVYSPSSLLLSGPNYSLFHPPEHTSVFE